MFRCTLLTGALMAALVSPVFSQPQDKGAAGPTYDVVSIRHAPRSVVLNNRTERPGGGYMLEKGSIATLIGQAYALSSRDIVGLPDWATRDAYDIVATASLPRTTQEDRRAMKRALLADRFRFRAHEETREQPSFDLVKARGDGRLGPGLIPYAVDCLALAKAQNDAEAAGQPRPESPPNECSMQVTRTGLSGAMPMEVLAALLGSIVGRPVVDKTGVAGTFRVRMAFDQPATTRADASPSDTLPSVYDALREQLGLELAPSRTQVRVLVVDAIERPTEN